MTYAGDPYPLVRSPWGNQRSVPAEKLAAVRREEGASALDNVGRPTTADAALGTLSSEAGAFGAALAGLGFGEFVDGTHWDTVYYRTESADGLLRVICYPSDGDRVEVIGWDPARPAAKLEAWRMTFTGSTPQSVVLAAIANAVGALPITRRRVDADHTCPVCPWTSGELRGEEATAAAHAHAAEPHAPKVAWTI